MDSNGSGPDNLFGPEQTENESLDTSAIQHEASNKMERKVYGRFLSCPIIKSQSSSTMSTFKTENEESRRYSESAPSTPFHGARNRLFNRPPYSERYSIDEESAPELPSPELVVKHRLRFLKRRFTNFFSKSTLSVNNTKPQRERPKYTVRYKISPSYKKFRIRIVYWCNAIMTDNIAPGALTGKISP